MYVCTRALSLRIVWTSGRIGVGFRRKLSGGVESGGAHPMERTHRERKHVCRRRLFLFINEQRARIAAGTGNKMVNMIRTGGKLQRTCCKSVKERKTFQSPPGSSVTTSLTLPECEGCICQSCSSGKRRKQDRKGTHRV